MKKSEKPNYTSNIRTTIGLLWMHQYPIFEKKYLYNNSYTNILNNLYLFGIGFKAYITYK